MAFKYPASLPKGDPRHGSPGGYKNHGCHCTPCTAANTRQRAEYMATHPEARERHAERERARRARKKVEMKVDSGK